MSSEGAEGSAAAKYAERRQRVLHALDGAALVVATAPVRYKNADTEYRYRPDSDLLYLTGMSEPDGVLVLCGRPDEQRSVLFLAERNPAAERWHGPRVGPEDGAERFGVDEALPLASLPSALGGLLSSADAVHYRTGASTELDALVAGAISAGRASRRRSGTGPTAVCDPSGVLDELRLRKDPSEVAIIRRACSLTVAGHRAGLGAVAPGRGEWEVEATIDARFRAGGAFGAAFGTIVASGPNACVLHHTSNDRVIEDGDLVLIDAGAEVDFYSGDVTRTVPASGRFSPEQRALYEVVEAAREAGVQAVAPGAAVSAPHAAALDVMVTGLVALGVLSGDREEALADASFEAFIIHKTSHWLGLDVHDVGGYTSEGVARPLEPGMVLTVEPGIYIPVDSDAVPEAFRGLGVRIEDDVLVTPDGRENLTGELPSAPDEVEALMAELHDVQA